MSRSAFKGILIVIGLGFIGLLPHVLPVIHINMLIEVAFYSLFAVSFNLLFGYGGLLSFGHAAYFGIGAYTVALLIKYVAGFPLLPALLLGGVAGGLGGLLAGFFCVRLKGAYFALLTLAFNQFFFAIALKWRSLTGGDDGMSLKRPDLYLPGIGSVPMNNAVHIYYLVVAIVIICVLIQWSLTRTPLGNAMRAVKENDERAGFIGYNVFLTRLTLYTVAAFFAGMAGSLFALFQGFVSTGCIDAASSMHVVFMAFIGGVGSFLGPVLGAGVYLYFTDWVSRITDRWEFVLGVLFILLVLYARTGLVGLISSPRLKALVGLSGHAKGQRP
ncbi:MAG: branched-chain amino acid ABC transporter permease [Deltaproteobacteria bacterium]|nr:branched-chain amino acid ABC transporter permease [Deltaproteobacteria bacterium]